MGMYIALIIFNIAWAYNTQSDVCVFLAGFNTGALTLLAIKEKLDNHQEH